MIMNENKLPYKVADKIRQLSLERKRVLAMQPDEALQAIMDASQPVPLVHSFSSEDLYFLVHDIGPEDALPILSLASDRQWEYLLDTEIWTRDGIDQHQTTRWLNLFFMAAPERLVRMCAESKRELFELYLMRNIEIKIREHDQSPSELGKGFFSDDDTYYVRLIDFKSAGEEGRIFKEQCKALLPELLRRISKYDHLQYQKLLLETSSLLPAELEENHYRLRNMRLAEKGFLPFDEAIEIYRPLQPEMLQEKTIRHLRADGKDQASLPVPLLATGMLKEENLFTQALFSISDEVELETLMAEFTGLCNQVIVADRNKITNRQLLARVVKKVSDHISLGLEVILGGAKPAAPLEAAGLMNRYILANLFQVGFGTVLTLKWKAEKWRRESWFENAGLPLSFWGEKWLGVLGGLLIKKPLYYIDAAAGQRYREFATLKDRDRTAAVLKRIIAVDDLLGLISIPIDPTAEHGFINYKSLLLTLWARHHLGIGSPDNHLMPMGMSDFRRFFAELWAHKTAPRKTNPVMKELFLAWLAENSGLETHQIAERMGSILEEMFKEIEEELGNIESANLDPRYILLFHIK
jgi:hypothetical protein